MVIAEENRGVLVENTGWNSRPDTYGSIRHGSENNTNGFSCVVVYICCFRRQQKESLIE